MRLVPLLAALAAASLFVPQVSAEPADRAEAPTSVVSPTAIVTVTAASAPGGTPLPAVGSGAEVGEPAKVVVTPVAVPAKPVATTLAVNIDLSAQRMTLSYGGRTQESWPISSGRAGFATPRGVFRPQWAAKMWFSRKYDNAPMPHAVFFNGGVAVHATQATGMLGRPASHGCVRLSAANARRFYNLVHQHGYKSTRISVIGTPPASRIAKRAPARDVGPRAASPTVRRAANGVVYLPPGSAYQGRSSFVMNGVTYVRVR